MDLGLTDRVFVLTGASRGLGRATAEALVADGARVVLSGRDSEQVAATVTGLGGPAVAAGLVLDNADPAAPQRLLDAATDRFGRFDGALISVGGPPGSTVAGAGDEQWRAAFESIFLGGIRLARTFARSLSDPAREPAEDAGCVAFVLSTSVREPIRGLGISNGLRPGLAGAAKDLAVEFGPHGVRVNALLPGSIETDRVRDIDGRAPDPHRAHAERIAGVPLARYGRPAEFGRVAAFLLSPAASYLSGVMLPVDGGAIRAL